ncbi:MAG: DUF411 domain-containing protein, partial [Gammaproteobacteria bacterium]
MRVSRRSFGLVLVLLYAAVPVMAAEPAATPLIVKVWKTPTCGCCGKWVKHLQASGFRVEVTDLPSLDAVRAANGIPARLSSCHTALVGGYVIEGHVPASDVRRLLAEKPGILGLSAPGMPPGSPGMDVPGSPAYDVISFDKDGRTAVY